MPRDDLSIDFVKGMPPIEALDPALIMDEWFNRVANLPEEIRFIQEEIADKDRQFNDCLKTVEDRDGRIQKWIKANGSHEPNPKEAGYRTTIRENYAKADQLAAEKIALTQRMQTIMDKHIRFLDIQIKQLYDRSEPGFVDPEELPSLLRPSASAANTAEQPSAVANLRFPAPSPGTTVTPLAPITNSAAQSAVRAANPQVRSVQSQPHNSASAPASPAASHLLHRQARESSAGPTGGVLKRGPRSNSGLGNAPATSSGLARHSSLGPGTPKSHNTATGVQRAGSAGPRPGTKVSSAGPGRKAGTPTLGPAGRKKMNPGGTGPGNKSGLSRVRRAAKNSPASTADSELSDAESGSGDGSDAGTGGRRTPSGIKVASSTEPAAEGQATQPGAARAGGRRGRRSKKDGPPEDDLDAMDLDDDDAGDDKKYCMCRNVSFGDMVACDNDSCPYEWFHWSCVGLKSEPNGTWYCPMCTESMKKKGK